MLRKKVHFLSCKVQTVQGSKYGTVPSNTVQLAGLHLMTAAVLEVKRGLIRHMHHHIIAIGQ